MRNNFFQHLFEKMKADKNIFFITADMGINLVEKIQMEFPDRYLNVGISEQNAIGVAAGLAESGYKPYVYSISNFLTLRAYEQVRNDVCIHNLPVVLVGTSTGFDNGPLGPTHHMLDDWGILTGLRNIEIYCPGSLKDFESITQHIFDVKGPTYLRIPKGNGVDASKNEIEITNLQKLSILENEIENLVLSYGSACDFAQKYSLQINAKFLRTIKLFPIEEKLLKILKLAKIIHVVEDHFANIGMYSQVVQKLNESGIFVQVKSISPKKYSKIVAYNPEEFIYE